MLVMPIASDRCWVGFTVSADPNWQMATSCEIALVTCACQAGSRTVAIAIII